MKKRGVVRNFIWEWLKEKWDRYQTQKKSDALWNKLHRHCKNGKPIRFSKKNYIKFCNDAKKAEKNKK